ncbi:MAG: ADOP family duplicated permease [Vicinamibacterales bacterium]
MTPRPDDIDRELRFHIEMRARELEAAGLPAERARREAERMFGRRRRIAARCARAWRRPKGVIMETLRHDLRDALRAMLRQPGLTAVMFATLALGLGATTAIFTLVEAVVLRPLAYPESDRLIWLHSRVKGYEARPWGASSAGYFHFRDRNETLASMGAFSVNQTNLVDGAGAERVSVASATASLRDVLRVPMAHGRWIAPEEDVPNGPAVIALSHAFWQRRYGGDPAIVGRSISIAGVPTEVIGVLGRGVELPLEPVEIYGPLRLNPDAPAINSHYLSVVARMKAAVPIATVRADLRRLDGQLTERFPNAYPRSFMSTFATEVLPLRDRVVGSISRTLWILLAAVSLVLLIACANVASLYLVRTEARRREIAIRAAVGATRRRLAGHFIVEGLLLTGCAAAAGLALAAVSLRVLLAAEAVEIPRLQEIEIRASSVAFAAAIAVAAGLILGLIPLAHARGGIAALSDGGRTMTASRGRQALRRTLVGAEMALALVLLSAALLLAQSFSRLRAVEPGFRPDGVLAFDLSLPFLRYRTHDDVARAHREVTSRLETLPGVERAAVTTDVPLVSWAGCVATWMERPGAAEQQGRCVSVVNATPGFAEALGLRVTGATPGWALHDAHQGRVLITRALAERYWPGQDPVGQRVSSYWTGPPFYEISGVVEGLRAAGLDEPPVEALIYPVLPIQPRSTWIPPRQVSVIVRARVDPQSLAAAVRREINAIDSELPMANVMTMEQAVARSMSRVTFVMTLIALAAGMALILSLIGVYGVLSHLADQRRSEIGIRIALGAPLASVRRLIVGQSFVLIAAGIAAGSAVSLLTSRTLSSMLFGVEPRDLPTLAFAAAVVGITGLVAAWMPAARAARINPIESLRG